MTNDDYKLNMDTIVSGIQVINTLTNHISDEDLNTMIATIHRCHSVGAMIDPTAYKEALQDNRLDRQMAFIKLIQSVRAIYKET